MADYEYHYDFGSPNCYMAEAALSAIEARRGVTFERVPILLGGIFKATGNQAPFATHGHVKNKIAYTKLEIVRFLKRHRLSSFKMNPYFPVNTLALMRGITGAKAAGEDRAYLPVLYKAMWEEGLAMADPEVIRIRLDQAGLDGAKFLAWGAEPDVKAALAAATERSVTMGSFGAPTFYVKGEVYFGKDSLRDLEDAIAS